MNKETEQSSSLPDTPNVLSGESSENHPNINRRKFVGVVASSALTFSILPRHVLGGKNFVAPSDKITLAYIGTGTEGIRELLPMLANTQLRVTAVCDANKDAVGYKDWSKDGLKNEVRKTIKKSDWEPGGDNTIPGGRDAGKSIVDNYYANVHPEYSQKGCASYEDVRELFDKEKDLNAVKIMTPDHLHGILSMAAMKKGKHVIVHKPLSNRLMEGRRAVEMARNSNVITHLMPWDANGSMETIMAWINAGAIGNLTEVHTWTNRPVWPQYPTLPTETPAVPSGLNWDLWLGPEADRAYSPNYTNMVFRGWYDFGGGSMADMGYYNLWAVFNALKLQGPTVIEPNLSHVIGMHDPVPFQIKNDFSFPMASSTRFKYPANGARPAIDLCWYEGGMRPAVPVELLDINKELANEGTMFVGDKGKILTGANLLDPQIISGQKMDPPAGAVTDKRTMIEREAANTQLFIDACISGKQYPGNFREAEFIMEAANLYAVALRTGKLLKYDAANVKITNYPDANKYLDREYRKGWDIASF